MASKSMAPTAALLPAIAVVAFLLVASTLAQPHGVIPASPPCNNGLEGEISDAVEGIVRDLLEMVQAINQTIAGIPDSLNLTRPV